MFSVLNALNSNAHTRPTVMAFKDPQGEITWGDLQKRISALAVHLENFPSVIGISLPNSIDYVIADLAATLAGNG
jgi:acyl-CoA synthetase (AMP-forming)/AMP-acid ligase II